MYSYSCLPGPLTAKNNHADSLLIASAFSSALQTHAFFHQSAKALTKMFSIPLNHAKHII
jgi:hypothetical protein